MIDLFSLLVLISRIQGIPDERIEGIWRQIIDVFRGGILADWSASFVSPTVSTNANDSMIRSSAVEAFSLEVQEAEENFDLSLIAALEIDVIPQLGDRRISDSLVIQLAKVLSHGSRLHDLHNTRSENSSPPTKTNANRKSNDHDFETVDMSEYEIGSTVSGAPLPRERFSYWCFDLLCLVCSDTAKGTIPISGSITGTDTGAP